MSPMTALPVTRNAVPWNAVKILKTKNAARFGDNAVPMLNAVNSIALPTETCSSTISDAENRSVVLTRCLLVNAYPFPAVDITVWSIEARADAHEQHV